ncbi:hypothetical protein PN836_007590 [Ningiella sp. W23]|uniref:hypothetical protein n=1 Tax=Ningiella sp. W23 TaxID=3023715 RepID=UPI003757D07D
MMSAKRYAIGPMVGLPSTEWVGRDVAQYMQTQNINVELFKHYESLLDVDVVYVIKVMPSVSWLQKQKARGSKLIYFPVDIFDHPWREIMYREHFKYFDAFCVHNTRTQPIFNVEDARLFFVNHHLKYESNRSVEQTSGQVLWIGHLEYVPSLIMYLAKLPKLAENGFCILTDLEKYEFYRHQIQQELDEAGIDYSEEWENEASLLLSGHRLTQWSEQEQAKQLQSCVGAIDTKLDKYGHNFKPPTKAQKYIFNAIPFACPSTSYSSEYFHQIGFEVPDSSDIESLCSADYFAKVTEFAKANRHMVEIDSVAKSYLYADSASTFRPKPGSVWLSNTRNAINQIHVFVIRAVKKLAKIIKRK